MTTMLSLNVLNVLIIQIKMAFYYLHLLLSMVHVVHSSRDHLQLIKEFYKKRYMEFHRCASIVSKKHISRRSGPIVVC